MLMISYIMPTRAQSQKLYKSYRTLLTSMCIYACTSVFDKVLYGVSNGAVVSRYRYVSMCVCTCDVEYADQDFE